MDPFPTWTISASNQPSQPFRPRRWIMAPVHLIAFSSGLIICDDLNSSIYLFGVTAHMENSKKRLSQISDLGTFSIPFPAVARSPQLPGRGRYFWHWLRLVPTYRRNQPLINYDILNITFDSFPVMGPGESKAPFAAAKWQPKVCFK